MLIPPPLTDVTPRYGDRFRKFGHCGFSKLATNHGTGQYPLPVLAPLPEKGASRRFKMVHFLSAASFSDTEAAQTLADRFSMPWHMKHRYVASHSAPAVSSGRTVSSRIVGFLQVGQ